MTVIYLDCNFQVEKVACTMDLSIGRHVCFLVVHHRRKLFAFSHYQMNIKARKKYYLA